MKNGFTFDLFNSFPSEIHSMILESCEENDSMCLRLTCKYLYGLPLMKPLLSLYDSLSSFPCEARYKPRSNNVHEEYLHRPECHKATYEKYSQFLKAKGKAVPALGWCSVRTRGSHCVCYDQGKKLHQQLRSWVPKHLKFCDRCGRFTQRKRGHNDICYHGYGKRRRPKVTLWTHRSRKGAFGRTLWKKWFRNRYEANLRAEKERKGTGRYDMRKLEPKMVDTCWMR